MKTDSAPHNENVLPRFVPKENPAAKTGDKVVGGETIEASKD